MTFLAFQGSIELGIIYALMALGVFISFRTLNMPDLTVDGSFVLGAACSATFCSLGHPFLGILIAILAGSLAGSCTALLHTKLKIQPLLAGILMMLALYSVNLRVMSGRANIALVNNTTVFRFFPGTIMEQYAGIIIPGLVLLIIAGLIFWFLQTRFGLVLRATGDNDQMVRAVGVNTDTTILIGLALANSLVALSGSLIAQYQSFADISMGVGMVVIGLASVIVGEVLFGIKSLLRRLIAVILGAILYRMVIALALEMGMPTTDLKLISAIIVALALSAPVIKEHLAAIKRRHAVREGGDRNHV